MIWWNENLLIFVFFFFKQKTEYEMRISDWSSDVCSSDLKGDRDARQVLSLLHRRQGDRRQHRSRSTGQVLRQARDAGCVRGHGGGAQGDRGGSEGGAGDGGVPARCSAQIGRAHV